MNRNKYYLFIFILLSLSVSGFSQKRNRNAKAIAKVSPQKTIEQQYEDIADEALHDKDYEKAYKYLKLVTNENPNNSRAFFNLAWTLAIQEKSEEAISVSKKALESETIYNENRGEFFRMMGNCYTELHDLKNGEEYLLKAIHFDDSDYMAYYNLGYNRYEAKKYADAVLYLTSALEKGFEENEDPHDTYFYIGTCLNQLGQNEEALVYFDKALSSNDFENYYFNKIETLLDMKRYNDALTLADKALEKNPNSAILYFKRHQVYKYLRNKLKSDEDIQQAYKYDPKDSDILLDMGVMYADNNEMGKALNFYHESLKNGAEPAGIYENIANLYENNNETSDSATYYYKKAIETDPSQPQFYYNYGNLLKKNGDSKSAIEKYLTAIDMDPENDSFYTNIGIAYMDLEDYAKAKEYFLKGLKIAPDDYELNADMSEISFNHDKDYQATVDYSTKALKVIYGGKDKAQLLDIRGDARLMLGDYQSALQDYLEIINRFSEEEKSVNGSSYANVGYCYLGMKNYSLAKKYFDISLGYQTQIDPLIGLMIMYYEQGDKENLKKTKSMAIKVEPALKKGMEGMKKIEADGYFYSAEQKDVLKAIFGK